MERKGEDAIGGEGSYEVQLGACYTPPQEGRLLLNCINETYPNLTITSPLSLAGEEGLSFPITFFHCSCPQKMPSSQKLPLPRGKQVPHRRTYKPLALDGFQSCFPLFSYAGISLAFQLFYHCFDNVFHK